MENSVILHLLVAQVVILFPVIDATTTVTIGQQQVSAVLSQPATLNCNYTTTGTGRITVEWLRDPAGENELILDHEVGADTFYYGDQVGRISLVDSASLQINMTNTTDAGVYRCTVGAVGAGQGSGDVTLQIYELPRNVTVSSSVTGVIGAGATVTFTCHSTGGKPPPSSYIWLKDGTTIGTSTSNTLVISSFNTRHEGKYSCIASNIAGNVTSSTSVQLTFDDEVTRISGIVLGVTVPLIYLVPLAILIWCLRRGRLKPTIIIEPSPSSHREVEVKWTGESEGTYTVLYRTKGSHDWTSGPEVSTNDPHNYNYTVTFPKHGCYEVCVQGTITCWQCKVTSDIMEVTVPIIETAPNVGPDDDGSSDGRNIPV